MIESNEPRNGYEFLDRLRQQDGQRAPKFNAFSEFLEAKARTQGVPIHGQFELTPLCNLDCRMCYVHLAPHQMQGRTPLSAEQWKGLMHQAFEAGMFQATLTGGECLAYPGFDELYLYLHSLGCQVDVLTNGTLLDEARIDFFHRHPPGLLQITLYGDSEETYERVTGRRMFHTVTENLQKIKEEGLPLSISITPNRTMGRSVFETIRLAKSFTENLFINMSLFTPRGESWRRGEDEDPDVGFYTEILRYHRQLQGSPVHELPQSELPVPGGSCDACQERGLKCGGGRSGFLINWKGEMRICNRLGTESFPLRDGFRKAWQQVHEEAENWPRAAQCTGCAYEEVCSGCAADALKYARPGKLPEGLCERTRYMVSRGVIPFSCSEPNQAGSLPETGGIY